MSMNRRIYVLLAAVILSTAASFAQQVKTDYDRTADFSRYRTYSWQNVHTQDPFWVDRIKAAVDSALAAKGWTKVESGGDVSVMAMEMTEEHRTLNTYYDNYGGGWGWRWRGFGDIGTATTTEDVYSVGTLVVDFFDTSAKRIIWRGSASETISHKSAKNIRNLDKGVQKMFEHFPGDARSTR
jgi:uncharacterized protein DUF4136